MQTGFGECDYIIGAGAMLTAGGETSIARATLHAQTIDLDARNTKGMVIDFEASRPAELRRLLILGVGLSPQSFHDGVTKRLIGCGCCGLEQVIALLAEGLHTAEIYWCARWSPNDMVLRYLGSRGIKLVVRPLETIARAALVIERSFQTWNGAPELAA
ncbi:MAG: hypothetical protein M3Z14_04570 [Candidatus Eremiobacteraeota bacterium]|nr:hypothetical protein [Candidatus Eremiobacteraeota bacterium]